MNSRQGRPITILMADDDADDRLLTKEAFEESHLSNDLRFVEDGVEHRRLGVGWQHQALDHGRAAGHAGGPGDRLE